MVGFASDVLEEEEHGLRAIFTFFKLFQNMLFYLVLAFAYHTERVAQLARFCVVKVRSQVLLPCGPKHIFFITCFLIFFTNFTNFVQIAKLIILSWFFAHISFKMSILWLLQKIPKMLTFWLFFIYWKISHFNDLKIISLWFFSNSNQFSHFTSIFCFILNIVWCS